MDAQTTAGDIDPASVNALVRESYPGSRIQCTSLTATEAMARSVPSADDIRPGGFISGPTQFALADAALWYLVFGALGRVELMALTSELSIRFLRPAIGDVLYGRAELASVSRRSVVGSVSVWAGDNEHRPSAVAQGTYALPLDMSERIRE
jgi:acyl-coenzyme A thioesterase PaaI-like protein